MAEEDAEYDRFERPRAQGCAVVGFVASIVGLLLLAGMVWITRSCEALFADTCRDSAEPLVAASSKGDTAEAARLLDSGASPEGSGESRSPLGCAVENKQTAAVQLLVKRGARTSGPSLLNKAVDQRNATMAASLFEGGASITPPATAALDSSTGNPDLFALLLDHGAKPERGTLYAVAGGAPLGGGFAVPEGPGDDDKTGRVADMILDHGVDPNGEASGPSPLLWAAFNGRARVVDSLLRHGANPDHGGTVPSALIMAARSATGSPGSTLQSVGTLVPQPSASMVDDVPPLLGAIFGRRPEIVNRLLQAGANPNAVSDKRVTPLLLAATLGQNDSVRALLQAGANPQPLVAPGVFAPAEAARRAGHTDTAQIIEGGG